MTFTTPTGRTILCTTPAEISRVSAWLAWMRREQKAREARAKLREQGLCGAPLADNPTLGCVHALYHGRCPVHGDRDMSVYDMDRRAKVS